MRLLPLTLTVSMLGACASLTTNVTGEVTYAKDAKGNYDLGERALKDHSWQDASQYFNYTKTKFPFSQYAPLSALRVADAAYLQDKYIEAIDAYKNFMKDHPTHPKVDYASFQIAKCHYKDLPSGFFLFPPVYEKDQGALVETQGAIRDFLLSFPKSDSRPEAERLLADVRHRLAEHEMYVARFYLGRGFKKAAAWRYEFVVKNFADTDFAVEASKRAGELYAKLPPDTRHEGQQILPPRDPSPY